MSQIAASRTTGDSEETVDSKIGNMERVLRDMNFDPAARKPTLFRMRAQLPKQGRGQAMLGATDRMWANLKVYASGGENTLHAHTNEDHMFVILQGSATFRDPDNKNVSLGRNEGILLPRGTSYSFTADVGEPLVMLRVGCVVDASKNPWGRTGESGEQLVGTDKDNNSEPTIFYEDRFFE